MLRRKRSGVLRGAVVGALCALLAHGPARAEGDPGSAPGPSKPSKKTTARAETLPQPWLQKSKVTLELSCLAGATVAIDGRELGKTPLAPQRLEVARPQFRILAHLRQKRVHRRARPVEVGARLLAVAPGFVARGHGPRPLPGHAR